MEATGQDKKHREELPSPAFSRSDVSLWSVLKQSIGQDLAKMAMPIVFNEPLSFLQRLAEYMEYGYLLNIAAQAVDPLDRIKYVAAFAVSGLSSNWERLGKPFNPLLYETYELHRPDFRILCEQVSHHPPGSAFHAESEHFKFHGSIYPRIKLWGKSVEIIPKGTLTVEFPKWNEVYTWTNVNCCVHNIIVGKLWMEQYGTMEITNHTTGHKCVLTFKPAGWFSRDLHRIEGYVADKNKQKHLFLYGKWTDIVKCTDYASYEKSNGSTSRQAGKEESSSHTPRKMLAKLNSLTIGSFRQSVDNVSNDSDDQPPPDVPEGDIPKSSSTISLELPNSITLWQVSPRPSLSAEFYHFTSFAISLNEIDPDLRRVLCPTDSRLRPDIRLLEEGHVNEASDEKTRLEVKQREVRKNRKANKEKDPKPRWFEYTINPYTKQEDWVYKGGYWDRNYKNIPDIY